MRNIILGLFFIMVANIISVKAYYKDKEIQEVISRIGFIISSWFGLFLLGVGLLLFMLTTGYKHYLLLGLAFPCLLMFFKSQRM